MTLHIDEWSDQGLCRQSNEDWWFPPPHYAGRESVAKAVAICEHCPVKDHCYEWAMHYEPFGVWGGTTADWRKKNRKRLGYKLKKEERV